MSPEREEEVFYDRGGIIVDVERITLLLATGHHTAVDEVPIDSITEATIIRSHPDYRAAGFWAGLTLLSALVFFWPDHPVEWVVVVVGNAMVAAASMIRAIRSKPVLSLVVQSAGCPRSFQETRT